MRESQKRDFFFVTEKVVTLVPSFVIVIRRRREDSLVRLNSIHIVFNLLLVLISLIDIRKHVANCSLFSFDFHQLCNYIMF